MGLRFGGFGLYLVFGWVWGLLFAAGLGGLTCDLDFWYFGVDFDFVVRFRCLLVVCCLGLVLGFSLVYFWV